MPGPIVILDNVRSAHNVGSIFRTADGAGATHLYLCGYTPAPLDRFGRTVMEIAKTSLGASESLSWTAVNDAAVLGIITKLKADGYTIVAVEQTPQAVSLNNFLRPQLVAYVFGNEVDGVGTTWLDAADQVVHIPMRGKKESLNVSVCAGIVLFH